MKSLINLNRITKISYMIGISCLVIGIMFSFVTQTGEAATANNSKCGSDYTSKDDSAPFEYKGSKIIDKVIIKAGDGCFKLKIGDTSNSCYKASGLGTSSVKVKMIGEEGPSCQAISHVLFFGDDPKPPTTEPPPTDVTPTEPTPTEATPTEPTPTEATPTEPTPTEPTPTEPTPTEPTPTDPTPTEPTPTDPTPTDPTPTDPTPTEPTDSPETVTPTEPPETPKTTDPPETPKETNPPKEKTPTPPPTLAQPTPMEGTPQILIPQTGVDLSSSNQIFGSQFFLLLGLTFIGIGMIFQGFSKRRI
jgi:hypothetical protein